MVSNVYYKLRSPFHGRLATLLLIPFFLFIGTSTSVFSFQSTHAFSANRIVEAIEFSNHDRVQEEFEILEHSLKTSDHVYKEAHEFFQSFINHLNMQYEFALDLLTACQLIKVHAKSLKIPKETRNLLLQTIYILESYDKKFLCDRKVISSYGLLEKLQSYKKNHGIYSPWEWNWFGLNKHNTNSKQNRNTYQFGSNPRDDLAILDDLALAGIEALTGALLCILPIPLAATIGGALILDAGRRTYELCGEQSAKNREKPL